MNGGRNQSEMIGPVRQSDEPLLTANASEGEGVEDEGKGRG